MEYFTWFYSRGEELYLSGWWYWLGFVNHFFSLPLLLRSLFSPWKRLSAGTGTSGFSISRALENFSFNLISRGIGFIVRIFLLLAGLFSFFGVLVLGAVGFLIWNILPPLGLPAYRRYLSRPLQFSQNLLAILKTSSDPVRDLFNNAAGKFVLARTGLSSPVLITAARSDYQFLTALSPKSYSDLISSFLEHRVWPDDTFRSVDLYPGDLIMAARWWDQKNDARTSSSNFGRSGIGLDLLFGYTPYLDQYASGLGTGPSDLRVIGREEILSRMERSLSTGSSVVLVGPPGVGKSSVIREFAGRAALGLLGSQLGYQRILELNFNVVLSGTTDVNLKKTILRYIFREAASAGNVILVIRDIQRLTTSWLEGLDFTDILEESLEKKDLRLITLADPGDYERFLAPNLRLRKSFETIDVPPLSKEQSLEVLLDRADHWERTSGILITIPALRKILDDSHRYLTDTPFPENALYLLDSVFTYQKRRGLTRVTEDDISGVLAEKTGIPFARLTMAEKKRLGRLEDIMKEHLVGQDLAVSLIAKSLRARTMGVGSTNRPVGSFLFFGPTGVGKTETAKVLSDVYYGSQEHILRFDMAEFAGHEGISRLIGSVGGNQPGALTSAIKQHSAAMLLADEIEKAPAEIFNLFLTLLDEGYITDAFGRKINCQHLFFIATSNAGSEVIRQLVSKGVTGDELQQQVLEHILMQRIFSPEFLNRFDGVVVYQPLSRENLVHIARLQLESLKAKLQEKHVRLEVTEEVCRKIAADGYNPTFGARPMRRLIDLVIGDMLSKAFLNDEIKAGDRIRLLALSAPSEYSYQKLSS